MHVSPLQDSIEQAKKSWEFSHLQSLREEEERIADDDVEDDMLLTYDRPELANKVILRRHSSTGMWEVCSPSKTTEPRKTSEIDCADVINSHGSDISIDERLLQEQHPIDPQTRGTLSSFATNKIQSEKDCGVLSIIKSAEVAVKRRSPRSVHLSIHNVDKKKPVDLDYVPLLEKTDSDGVGIVKHSSNSKRKSIDIDFKSPRLCLSPTLPYTYKFSRSQLSCDTIGSNDLDTSSHKHETDGFIGSRTRHRVSTEAQSNNQIHCTVSSPIHFNESSSTTSHKYPTRHKMSGQS